MASGKQKQTALVKTVEKQPRTKQAKTKPSLSAEQRFRMIQENAYYHAEKASFTGDSTEHWLTAEREFRERFE
ncbi:MAG: DUF2934 domain-containing protein [Gammaproteobacteria bacterium]